MKFRCTNCGSLEYKEKGSKLVCEFCGKEFDEFELQERLVKEEKEIDSFLKRNEYLFKKQYISEDETTENLLNMINQMKGSILDDFDEKSKSMKEALIDDLQNIIQDRLPTIQKELPLDSVSTSSLLNNAKNVEDFSVIAFLVRNNVENNLIHNFKLRHEKKSFVMGYDEYQTFQNEYTDEEGNHPFKVGFAKVISKNKVTKLPELVEMNPVVRFVKAGLTYAQAMKASRFWGMTNLFIHPSTENQEKIEEMLNAGTLKDIFKENIEFLRDKKLYTRN